MPRPAEGRAYEHPAEGRGKLMRENSSLPQCPPIWQPLKWGRVNSCPRLVARLGLGRGEAMLSLPFSLPLPQTYAAWPVWSDSTTQDIRFQPMPKRSAVRLWHRARDFDRG